MASFRLHFFVDAQVGMPFSHRKVFYNCSVFFLNGRILLIRPKFCLAGNGNYREARWFTAYTQRRTVEDHLLPDVLQEATGQESAPFGDAYLELNDASLGAEVRRGSCLLICCCCYCYCCCHCCCCSALSFLYMAVDFVCWKQRFVLVDISFVINRQLELQHCGSLWGDFLDRKGIGIRNRCLHQVDKCQLASIGDWKTFPWKFTIWRIATIL